MQYRFIPRILKHTTAARSISQNVYRKSYLEFNDNVTSARSILTPFYRQRYYSNFTRPPSHSTCSTQRTRKLPLKTISTTAALILGSSYYFYDKNDVVKNEAAEDFLAPMSAFNHSNTRSTVAELLDDTNRTAMQARSTEELLTGLFVYKLCSFPWLVEAAPYLITLAEKLHLESVMYWFVRHTFFTQFCGGETADECVATMTRLLQSGINCILDLSIEADLHMDDARVSVDSDSAKRGKYWQDDEKAERTLSLIKTCIKTASQGQNEEYTASGAFAAVKVTAFAPPEFLLRLNHVISYLNTAFETHQRDGYIDATGLKQIITQICPEPSSDEQRNIREEILDRLCREKKELDYFQYAKLFDLSNASRNIWWQPDYSKSENEVYLTEEDLQAYDRMMTRLNEVCQLAHQLRVGVMIDAEQSYFQEAIDHVAISLETKYNRRDDEEHSPTVYNTYQMYTKAAQKKLERDVEIAERGNFAFAAKLVRGAYMVTERKRAKKMHYESPIHETIEDTHASFNNGVRFLLGKLKEHQEIHSEPLAGTTAPVVFMVATHNKDSIIMTVKEMEKHNVLPRSGVVHFGQLYGMQDQISYTLGKNGYSIYKYLPYGTIEDVIPYLLRRAQENSAVLGGVDTEQGLMWDELKTRLFGAVQAPVDTTKAVAPVVDYTLENNTGAATEPTGVSTKTS
ncbi:FAD-linked oxidoreductase-like protein [Mycotypha africana]|uniref:FAD-linked oxidoreductase-like protein n=1 Tax=Mycotypha africana TaxID=64632 RepID=UPI002301232C|nr:FAD-linked oxidoreductase-like protein [Mycotypha africana]KAI8973583.1 FAD-linked oxidoreductase-like protein [Mycotypha africana]